MLYPMLLNGDHAEFEREHANTPPEERPDWPLPSFDARDWAKAFLKAYENGSDDFLDEGTMIGWFANALMRGYDEAKAKEIQASKAFVREFQTLRKFRDGFNSAFGDNLKVAEAIVRHHLTTPAVHGVLPDHKFRETARPCDLVADITSTLSARQADKALD